MIRAEIITTLLLGAAGPQPGKCPTVRLRGVYVSGCLDLTGATIGSGLICEGCRFEAAPRFTDAVARTICISGSWLPGLSGARMRIEGMLSLYRSTVAEVVIIDHARVTGKVCLREAEVGDGSGKIAVSAAGLTVDGDLDCAKITCRGAVELPGARITGLVDASSATVSCPGPRALDADNAVIGGHFEGMSMNVDGEFLLEHAQIGGFLSLRGARLSIPSGWALAGGGLTVASRMWVMMVSPPAAKYA